MRLHDAGSRTSTILRGLASALLPLLVAGAVGHAPDSAVATPARGGYDLTFEGDGSFGGPHGGQTIHVTVETTDGKEVASAEDTVSKTANPSFSFPFKAVLDAGQSYVIKYWIDSNFNGGTEGQCDSPSQDHQWELRPADHPQLGNVSGNVTIEDSHRPSQVEAVCSS